MKSPTPPPSHVFGPVPSRRIGRSLGVDLVPFKTCTYDCQMVDGLIALRREFIGQYWLEVFLLGGYTAIEANVKRLAALARRIGPDRVQLNTVARPPTEEFAMAVPPEALEKYAKFFDPPAEVIAERPSRLGHKSDKAQPAAVLEMLRRRPCTVEHVAQGLGLNRLEAIKKLEALMAKGQIETYRHEGEVFYRASGPIP